MTGIRRIFYLILLCPCLGWTLGGDQLGNGGDAVVCVVNGKQTYQLLDLYEGRMFYGFSYDRDLSSKEALFRVFEVLAKVDPARHCLYNRWLQGFASESKMLFSIFPNIRDEGLHAIPASCWVEQVVIRYDKPVYASKRYFLNGKVYPELHGVEKIGLMIHEFVYREGRHHDRDRFANSFRVRRFTAFLMAQDPASVSRKQYAQELRSVQLPIDERYCDRKHPIYHR